MPDTIYKTAAFFSLVSAAGFGFFIHAGQFVIATIWLFPTALHLYAFIKPYYNEIAGLRSTIGRLKEEQYVGTIEVNQLAKSNGEIELEVTSQ